MKSVIEIKRIKDNITHSVNKTSKDNISINDSDSKKEERAKLIRSREVKLASHM
jgi:hypothetical protein